MNMTKRQKKFGIREVTLGAAVAFAIGAALTAFAMQAFLPAAATSSPRDSISEKTGDVPLVEGM